MDSTSAINASASVNVQTGELSWTPPEVSAGDLVTLKVVATELSDAGLSTQQQVSFQVAKFDDPVRQPVAQRRRRGVAGQPRRQSANAANARSRAAA